ncbi:unnamed protein product [Moneuplotes crassus]|uniref:Uncharacterized protein n=1 Tax=Euplotes crassus TaxID=5936 RepID=A0AAD1U5J4_EUPCR|nr:unnamed protein product [Moneuplotes crassus]
MRLCVDKCGAWGILGGYTWLYEERGGFEGVEGEEWVVRVWSGVLGGGEGGLAIVRVCLVRL